MQRATLALLLAAAACGGLGTPDLGSGVVEGRIVGAGAGAYAYPLGRPDLVVRADAAGDFTFRFTLESGRHLLVLWDGIARAELVEAEAEGAEVEQLDDRHGEGSTSGEKMPLAGAVLAGVRAQGGALPLDPRYAVVGTDRAATGTPAAYLYPLPAGAFRLTAEMAGFRPGAADVAVAEGACTALELALEVDGAAQPKGCSATGGCEGGEVECDGDDGWCHPAAGACGEVCDAALGCPAGLVCEAAGQPCVAPLGCESYLAVVGSACVSEDTCQAALKDGRCLQADEHLAGTCTAPCQTTEDCRTFGAGWSCDPALELCLRP